MRIMRISVLVFLIMMPVLVMAGSFRTPYRAYRKTATTASTRTNPALPSNSGLSTGQDSDAGVVIVMLVAATMVALLVVRWLRVRSGNTGEVGIAVRGSRGLGASGIIHFSDTLTENGDTQVFESAAKRRSIAFLFVGPKALILTPHHFLLWIGKRRKFSGWEMLIWAIFLTMFIPGIVGVIVTEAGYTIGYMDVVELQRFWATLALCAVLLSYVPIWANNRASL